MQQWAKQFVAALHATGMRTRGFGRTRHTFSRDVGSHVEVFQVQGSAWNSNAQPTWTFFLNAGVRFPDLPGPTWNRGLPGTHVYERVSNFRASTQANFELTESNSHLVLNEVLASVDHTHDELALLLPQLRAAGVARRALWHVSMAQTDDGA